MKLCTGCFWKDDNKCMHDSATVKSPVDGTRRQRTCEIQRGNYPNLDDNCGLDGKFWMDKDCDICSICQEPLDPTDSVGDDEVMHLNCATGKAESAFEGDR